MAGNGIVAGKRFLITGVLTDASLAFNVARLAQEQGAEVVLTGAGRGLRLTERTARKLPEPCDVLACDVTVPDEIEAVRDDLEQRWGRLDGLLHAIGFAPESCLGGNFLHAVVAGIGGHHRLRHCLEYLGIQLGCVECADGSVAGRSKRLGGGSHLRCQCCVACV